MLSPTAAPYTFDIVHQISDIAAEEWDDLAVAGAAPFARHRWLRLAESVLIGHEPRYLLVRAGGRLEAAAVCAVRRRFEHPGLQRAAGRALRYFPGLRCALPIAFASGLLVRPGEDVPRRVAVLLAALDRLAARERAAFAKLEYLSPCEGVWPALRHAGFWQIGMWADTALEIAWPSFDGYLASLPAKKRKDVAKVRRRAAAQGIEVAPIRPSVDTAPQLWQLVANVLRHHGAEQTYHPDLFLRAADVLGDDLLVLAARREGQIVGCAGLLTSGAETSAKWLGLDYDRTWGTATYLSLLLECIAQAVAGGATCLRLGATAYDTKRHLGAVVAPRAGAVALRGRLLNHVASAVFHRLTAA
jgi:predicted N-acyltransferase